MRGIAAMGVVATLGTAIGPVAGVAETTAPPTVTPMTLRSVMLTQGGVGVFSYGQEVEGAAALALPVPLHAVSDALRSIRVRDPSGPVRAVTVPTGDTALAMSRTGDDWLQTLIGARVAVVMPGIDSAPMRGRVARAERIAATPTHPATARLTLLTELGLRQAVLENVAELRLEDPALRARIAEGLAQGSGTGREGRQPTRTLEVRLADGGRRAVTADLALPVPLWKPTWRLTLPPADQSGHPKARLQGWAVVENTSGADWTAVTLRLVAGNPVTVENDVYSVVEVARPVVEVAGPARPAPVVDTRATEPDQAAESPKMARSMAAPAPAPMVAAPSSPPPSPPAEVSEAAATSVFALSHPLDLDAGQTASVPFLDTELPVRLVDSLEPDAAHPIAAARIENDTGHTLPAGTVSTSAPGTAFAGDAVLGTFPAGQSRLLAFAEDGAVDAEWQHESNDGVVAVSASGGVLRTTTRERVKTTVTLTGAADEARSVLVAIERNADQDLSTESPKPLEATDTRWRFLVALKPGEHRSLVVSADRLASETLTIVDAKTPTLVELTDTGTLPAAARAALNHLIDLRAAVEAAQDRRATLAAERTRLVEDEDRARRNLTAVPASDPLHVRLIATLGTAEDRLSGLARDLDAADAALRTAQSQLRVATASLTL